MTELSKADIDSAVELASEMTWADAARYLRGELGWGLVHAGRYVEENMPRLYPDSICAQSLARRTEVNRENK